MYVTMLMPLIFGIVFSAELLWVWHSAVEFTRDGARYAATHCWQGSGENVRTYMQTHVPPMVDQQQFRSGPAEIAVEYFSRDPASGSLNEFACENGAECSTQCIPDVVTVQVTGYEYRRFFTALGLAGIPLPDFRTTVPMESAGCDPEQGVCLP